MERRRRKDVDPATAHPPYPPNCTVSFEDCASPRSPLFLFFCKFAAGRRYSITSSARVSSRAGGSMPSAFAVFRLIAR